MCVYILLFISFVNHKAVLSILSSWAVWLILTNLISPFDHIRARTFSRNFSANVTMQESALN